MRVDQVAVVQSNSAPPPSGDGEAPVLTPMEAALFLSDATLAMTLPADAPLELAQVASALTGAVAALPKREAVVVRMRFGLKKGPTTYKEIGRAIVVSVERTRQIERNRHREPGMGRALPPPPDPHA